MSGFPTLFYKEVLRFWKVSTQTIGAPVLTAVLFLFIFSHVMEGRTRMYDAVPYAAFLVPGLVMMSVLQNAFANSSSSLVQSKMTGNIIFVLLPPLAYWEFFGAYVLAAVVRGMVVGAAVLLVTLPFVEIEFRHPLWILAFGFCGSAVLGSLGMIAGIWSRKSTRSPLSRTSSSCLSPFFRGCSTRSIRSPLLARVLAFQPVFLHD